MDIDNAGPTTEAKTKPRPRMTEPQKLQQKLINKIHQVVELAASAGIEICIMRYHPGRCKCTPVSETLCTCLCVDSGVWPHVDLGGPARGPLHYMFLGRPDVWAYLLNIFSSFLITNQSDMLELASLANKSSFDIQQLRKQARAVRDELSSRVRIDETLEKELGAVVTGTNTLCKWDEINSQIMLMNSSTLTAFINWCGKKLECMGRSDSKQQQVGAMLVSIK